MPQHRALRIAVVIGLAVVLLVAADRATARIAGSKVAAELASGIRCVTGATVSPSVSISGFPFLAELAGGHFRSVTVTADDVTLGGSTPITVKSIAVTAQHVTRPQGDGPARIGAFSAEATVPYSVLPAELDGRRLRYGATPDGRLTISTTTRVSVLPLPVTVIASVRLANGVLSVTPQDIRILGIRRSIKELDGGLGRWLSRGQTGGTGGTSDGTSDTGDAGGTGGTDGTDVSQGAQRALPTLPAGMTYASATPTGAGLTIRMTGRNLDAPVADRKNCKN